MAVSPRASVASLPKLFQLTLTAWDAFFVPLQAVNPLSVLAGVQSATSRPSPTFCAGLSETACSQTTQNVNNPVHCGEETVARWAA